MAVYPGEETGEEEVMDRWLNKILLGLSEDVLKEMPDNSISSIVTDPPYGLKFMGKKWDYDVPPVALWEEAYRVLKPGAHVLSFGGTRTYHRMVVNIEDAGFEIRDQILWIYGSGFPKSLDVSKAIDKAAGAERKVIGIEDGRGRYDGCARESTLSSVGTGYGSIKDGRHSITAPATESAIRWEGWGTALKPAVEPICLARKPLEGTVANNVLKWGTGGLNIDECRIPTGDSLNGGSCIGSESCSPGWDRPWKRDAEKLRETAERAKLNVAKAEQLGRFPANVIHDGCDEVLAGFPDAGISSGGISKAGKFNNKYGKYSGDNPGNSAGGFLDSGSAARFFYCAKASTSERGDENNHPTVKPLDLIKYLIRLITPPDGIVLDMFGGSGTTALACLDLGFPYIVIEKEPDHVFIANERIKQATRQERLFL